MHIEVTQPLPREAPKPRRIVVQTLGDAIRMQRVSSDDEALAVRRAWERHDYRHWPGEIRLFKG